MDRPTDTIFQESWWLDAVAPDAWSAIEYREDGVLRAWMPLVDRPNRFGLSHCGMPPLTQTLGPWVQPVDGSSYRRITKIHDYISALVEQIPASDYFNQNAHYELEDVLPFSWQGYESRVRYTYVLEDLRDESTLWRNLSGRTRRAIRKAEKVLTIRETSDVELFTRLYAKTFSRQNIASPVGPQIIKQVYDAALAQKAVKLLVAEDAQGQAHGAVFLLYDERATYYLMGGSDPSLRDSQPLSLLLWSAIQFAASTSLKFDFEGSMIRSVEGFFRGFGSTRKTYYGITKMSPRFTLAWHARAALKSLVPKRS